MPMLAAEPTAFPSDLFQAPREAPSDRQWWVVYTRSRQEKSLARELVAREIPMYLPTVESERFIRGRRGRTFLPVFANYLFLFADDEERYKSLTTNRISRILPVGDQRQMWDELQALHRLIETDAPVTVEKRLTPGRRVRIKSGAMAGLEGVVIHRDNADRLRLDVTYLQQGVSIEIDDFMVEPV